MDPRDGQKTKVRAEQVPYESKPYSQGGGEPRRNDEDAPNYKPIGANRTFCAGTNSCHFLAACRTLHGGTVRRLIADSDSQVKRLKRRVAQLREELDGVQKEILEQERRKTELAGLLKVLDQPSLQNPESVGRLSTH